MSARRVWKRTCAASWLGLAGGVVFVWATGWGTPAVADGTDGAPAETAFGVDAERAALPEPVLRPLHPVAQLPRSLAVAVLEPDAAPAPVPAEDGWSIPASQVDPSKAIAEGPRAFQLLPDGTRLELTLDPALQRAAQDGLARYRVAYGAVVAIDPATGEILALAEHAEGQPELRHLALQAEGPAASLFKIVTAAALVEVGGLTADTSICTHGGRQGFALGHLEDDPRRDRDCGTLAQALGSSNNVAFGRWADRKLEPRDLETYAERFLFNHRLPFLWGVAMSRADIPSGSRLEFARAAAGFRGTTLSPLHAALIAAAVANHGQLMAPRLVRRATRDGEELYRAEHMALAQVVTPETAAQLLTMMTDTVTAGSAHKYFYKRKRPRIRGLSIAGKTGSLSASIGGASRHYSWFVAVAPAEDPQIAIGSLVVNGAVWTTKGAIPARHVLEAWAEQNKTRLPVQKGAADAAR